MKSSTFYFITLSFLVFSFSACQPDKDGDYTPVKTIKEAMVNISPEVKAGLEHQNLRLYPVNLTTDTSRDSKLKQVKTIKEGIETPGFYITEKKTYGRNGQRGTVSTLTVQNKSQDTIFLMQGDIVQGGNQDRILAEDRMILPNTIQDIPVFCVEKGRWEYKEADETESPEEQKKRRLFAFSGYYNVASNSLRRTVKESKNQEKVWSKVSEITSKQAATSSTSTYTALAESTKFSAQQNDYLEHYKNIFSESQNTVGIIAVSGSKILGVDVFNNPQLFQKKFDSLLHAYIVDAVNDGKKPSMAQERFSKLAKSYERQITEAFQKESHRKAYHFQGEMVHFVDIK